ncbi:hypothetical protein [Rubellicoccus peritrichatus]|uniref:Uncharacterized protein n=1 Tax=Rubellicoccus peritrichatus TaxID=3080537 RepID=A0AAQ3LCL5_9BACT|nr:hypothetical protein [Puniceicoccus sp. CR14]WOO43589.1 hypothetical protein RZN69_10865 [Puniceicoccus sp. CR14]
MYSCSIEISGIWIKGDLVFDDLDDMLTLVRKEIEENGVGNTEFFKKCDVL